MKDLIKKYDSIFNEIMELEKLLWKVPTYNFIKRNEIKNKIKLLINQLYKYERKKDNEKQIVFTRI